MLLKKLSWILIILMLVGFGLQAVSSTEYVSLADQLKITLQSNSAYTYFDIHTLKGDRYFGVNNTDGGIYFYNPNYKQNNLRIIPVVIGRVGSNNWLCPVRNSTDQVLYGNDIENGKFIQIKGNGIEQCYRQDNLGITTDINLILNELQFSLNQDNSIKITVNASVDNSVTVVNKGFGFLFVGNNHNVVSGGTSYSLATPQTLPVNYNLRLRDNFGQFDDIFSWGDMINTTNGIVIANYGGKTGALVYSYGYGSGNNLYIDPTYVADLSPEPAQYLINGSLKVHNNSQFYSILNITLNLSDNNYNTGVLVSEFNVAYSVQNFFDDFELPSGTNAFTSNWTITTNWLKNTGNTYTGNRKAEGNGDDGILQTRYFDVTCPVIFSYHRKLTFLDIFDLYSVEYNNGVNGLGGWVELDRAFGSDPAYIRFNHLITDCTNNISVRFNCRTSAISKRCWIENVELRSVNSSIGNGISVRFNQTYNSSYNYYLGAYINETMSGDSFKVYGYKDNNTLDSSNYVSNMIYSVAGWVYIPVNDIMQAELSYMNFSQFRFWIDSESEEFFKDFSVKEMRLRIDNLGQNPPSVSCQLNRTSSSFLNVSQLTRLDCNITDDIQVANATVLYSIESESSNVEYNSFLNVGTDYNFDFNCSESSHITIKSVSASDVTSQKTTKQLSLNLNCHPAPVVTVNFPQGHEVTKDVQIIYNFSQFAGYNNAYGNNCNFFIRNSLTSPLYVLVMNKSSPFIGWNFDTLSNMIGGYHDLKLVCNDRWLNSAEGYGFFNVTNSVISLPTIPPLANVTNITIFNATNCIYDSQPYFNKVPYLNEPISFTCNIGYNYRCFDTVKNDAGETLQINPSQSYTARMGLTNRFFESKGVVYNMYYTDSRLSVANNYTVEVYCNNNQNTVTTSFQVTPTFKNPDSVAYRGVWLAQNPTTALVLFVVVILFLIIAYYVLKRLGIIRW